MNDEFPFTNTRGFVQDKAGYLWIATKSGVVKYDGYEFEHFGKTADPGESSHIVETVYHDKNDGVWLGTLGNYGLEYYDRAEQKFKSKKFRHPIKQNEVFNPMSVYSIVQDQDELFWIGTNHGVYTYNPLKEDTISHRFIPVRGDPTSLDSYYAYEVYVDQNNTIWVGTNAGLNRFDRERKNFTNRKNNPNYLTGQILTIKESPNDELWVSGRATKDRIYRHKPAVDTFESVYSFDKKWGQYFNFDFQGDRYCWIASRIYGGLKYDMLTNTVELFGAHQGEFHGLTDLRTESVYVDNFENIWMGGRVTLKRPGSNKSIFSIKGNGFDVLAIHEEPDYIIYSLDEPYIWDKKTTQSKKFWTYPPVKNIRPSIHAEVIPLMVYEYQKRDENTLIFTSTRNIFEFDLTTKKMIDYPQDQGGAFRDFEFGEKVDMYISEGNHRPILFNFKEKFTSAPKGKEISKALYATSVAKDHRGIFWFGPRNGRLIRFDEHANKTEFFPIEIMEDGFIVKANYVRDIHPDSSGNIWVATEKGLWKFGSQEKFTKRIGKKNGMNTDLVESILEDEDQNLWLGTAAGLSFLDLSNDQVRNFNEQDGIINKRFTRGSKVKGQDGLLYFGGSQGVDFFHPKGIKKNLIKPKVLISEIIVNGKKIPYELEFDNGSSISLPYHQNYIEIELLALHLTAPAGNQYAHKINDQPWHEAGKDRRVILSNAQHGNYAIQAKVSNADGVWSEVKDIINIKIRPPWWKTWWFYSMCIIGLLTSIYLIYQYRVNQIRQREEIQTKFNKRIAEIEMKALRAQMNPHFLFNSLNSVKSLISKGKNVPATSYLTKFSKLIRQVLNNSRKKFVRLNDELEALRLYLELESMRFGETFEYDIKVAQNVKPDFLEVPPLLLQPYVENAIWHGLLHKEQGSKILSIHIDRIGDSIRMSVEDNGIGREASGRLRTRSSSKQESLGMKITEDRLNLLKEIYGGQAMIEVEDLKDGMGRGIGTVVRVTLPIPE